MCSESREFELDVEPLEVLFKIMKWIFYLKIGLNILVLTWN